MDNSVLLEEINKWNEIFISSTNIDETFYELAFFKIFIKFEKFLSDCFENYCIGNQSIHGFCPDRKLAFESLDQLYKIIQKQNSSFINHYEVIKKTSEYVFINDPFLIINGDSNYSSTINNMKTIRDYIAHESTSAKSKYINSVLNNKSFIEPAKHLKTINRSKNISYYSIYIDSIRDISNYIINSPDPN